MLTLTQVPYPYRELVTCRNLVPNPWPTSTSGWNYSPGTGGAAAFGVSSPGTMYAPDGTIVPAGSRILQVQTTAGTSRGGIYAQTAPGSITPGATYTASGYLVANPAVSLTVGMDFRNAAGTQIGTVSSAPVLAGPAVDGYQRASVTAVAPAGASYVFLTVYTTANAIPANVTFGGTAFAVTPGPLVPYFDGYTPPAPGVQYAWAGTPHASESTQTTRTPTAAAGTITLEAPAALTTLVTGWTEDRANPAPLHQVIGRADPLPVLTPVRTRTGQLEVWCDSYARARAIVDLYVRAKGLVLVRDPANPGRDMYHLATSMPVTTVDEAKRRWSVTVSFSEVLGSVAAW